MTKPLPLDTCSKGLTLNIRGTKRIMSTKKLKHKQSCLRQKFMGAVLLKSVTNMYEGREALLTKEERDQLKRDFITENLEALVNNGLWEINI